MVTRSNSVQTRIFIPFVVLRIQRTYIYPRTLQPHKNCPSRPSLSAAQVERVGAVLFGGLPLCLVTRPQTLRTPRDITSAAPAPRRRTGVGDVAAGACQAATLLEKLVRQGRRRRRRGCSRLLCGTDFGR